MDFQKLTTDDLLTLLPSSEDDRWEFKSASYLLPANRGEFKKELGKQVSAFANSGGGNLVFGISKTRTIESCEQQVGRESMKDYLATMVEQSVEYQLRHFNVHRVPLTSDPTQSIFVIVIDDSPGAPHQAKEERNYFYRIDGHSKPAPHFHIELLRNRMTRAIVEVQSIQLGLETLGTLRSHMPIDPKKKTYPFIVSACVKLRNPSLQIAAPFALLVASDHESLWSVDTKGSPPLNEGVLIACENGGLFPTATFKCNFDFVRAIPIDGFKLDFCREILTDLTFTIRPLSQNYAAEPRKVAALDYLKDSDIHVALRDRERLSSQAGR